jgi:hypothetical protein
MIHPSQVARAVDTTNETGLLPVAIAAAALTNALEAEWPYLARMPAHVRVHLDALRDALEGAGR